jgi:glutaredoxin
MSLINNETSINIDSIIKKGLELRSEDVLSKENEIFNQNTIYRFKFTEDFISELYKFSKIHQYDDRKGFKEAWKIWTLENDDIIESEMRRLLRLGYNGDVLDKMFKSARYYFRKKATEKKEPKQRRQYISVSKELLEAMDLHIHNNSFQPKDGFCDFCKKNENLLKDSISKIFEQGIKDKDIIEDKIKKTYKNRYFMIANSQ